MGRLQLGETRGTGPRESGRAWVPLRLKPLEPWSITRLSAYRLTSGLAACVRESYSTRLARADPASTRARGARLSPEQRALLPRATSRKPLFLASHCRGGSTCDAAGLATSNDLALPMARCTFGLPLRAAVPPAPAPPPAVHRMTGLRRRMTGPRPPAQARRPTSRRGMGEVRRLPEPVLDGALARAYRFFAYFFQPRAPRGNLGRVHRLLLA